MPPDLRIIATDARGVPMAFDSLVSNRESAAAVGESDQLNENRMEESQSLQLSNQNKLIKDLTKVTNCKLFKSVVINKIL